MAAASAPLSAVLPLEVMAAMSPRISFMAEALAGPVTSVSGKRRIVASRPDGYLLTTTFPVMPAWMVHS